MKSKQFVAAVLALCMAVAFTSCATTAESTSQAPLARTATSEPVPTQTPQPTQVPEPTQVSEPAASKECTPCKRKAELKEAGVLFGNSEYTWDNFSQEYPLHFEDGSLNVVANSFESKLAKNPQASEYPTAEEFAGLWGYQLYPDAQKAIEDVLAEYSCANTIYKFDPYLIQYVFGIKDMGDTLGYAGAYAASAGMVVYLTFDPDYTLEMLEVFKEYDQFLQDTFYNSGKSELETLQRSKSFYEVYDGYALFVIPFAVTENPGMSSTIENYTSGIDALINDLRVTFGSANAVYSLTEETSND